ncbi:prepilin-type N-terminal cleavage/methylation domain-containing protein [Amphritea opalescens]|uniref:Prepilin-type N-terminal cleavage/methylation domain-containing protein n=1 Tax=Amphritea opalescens TaxID=2490544 RepID=A0A430KLM6_9GAMM|nr:PilW family protein [Amphritea opalescens]RTE64375.1 prepilin-type N-terminal cleavage/methylation domain-containing protein [Amphritea opalescens]
MNSPLHECQRGNQTGLSLIELMIAMVIGLLLTAAVLQVFVGSRATYSMQTGLAKLQENGRFATQYLSRDLRKTGFMGCSSSNTLTSILVDDGSAIWDFIDFSNELSGEDDVDGTATYGTKSPIAGTDTITIKYADSGNKCTVSQLTGTDISCDATPSFEKGDVLIMSDCSSSAVFQKSNGVSSLIKYEDSGVTPGNSSVTLNPFPQDSSVFQLQAYRFFVANNEYGQSSLYRQGISNSAGVLSFAEPIELVEGVASMQILYGEDTSGDSRPNRYVSAGAVSDFDNVIALRVSLLIESSEDSLVREGQSLVFNGATVNFNDGRLRKVFTTTIAIRNRLKI